MLFHYTDRDGWNGIRSQVTWRFKVSQTRSPDRPTGAYFTSISPEPANFRTLHKKLRVLKIKQAYVFAFQGDEGLKKLNDGCGRDQFIFHSATDYFVEEPRQVYQGESAAFPGVAP